MKISDIIKAILSIFGASKRTDIEEDALKSWFSKNSIPWDWKDYQKKNKISKDVILNKNKRNGRFLFKGGNSDDETQPRLRVQKGNLINTAISGGGGVEFYGTHQCVGCYHHGPSERGVKMREKSQVTHRGCLFHNYDPHTILVAGNTKTELIDCVAVNCKAVWRPMLRKHGPKGPHDNPQGFFKQEGSTLWVKNLTLVNSDLGALRHPGDKVYIDELTLKGKSKGIKVEHKALEENVVVKKGE